MKQSAQMEALYSKVSRRIIPILIVSYIVAYLDRVNVGFAKLQMLQDLQFSETVYGLGAGIFFIGYFLFEVPSNMILHRVGARVWITRIMVTWGFISALTMFVTTPTQFYVVRFLLGVAEAGFFPGVILYLTQWFPTSRRGKTTAVFMTGAAISNVFGSLLSGWIMQAFDGLNGWGGWQWLFLLEALPAIAMGIVIYSMLDDRIDDATWLSAQERALLKADLQLDSDPSRETSFMAAFRDGRVWYACLIYFCTAAGAYGIGFWLPTIISDMGFSSMTDIGMLTAIPYAAAAVCMVAIGYSSDRTGERRWHLALPAAVGAVALAASVSFGHNAFIAMTALTFACMGIFTVASLFWSIPTAYLRGAAAAAGIAIINSCANLAGFVTPYLVGWIKDSTGSTAIGMYIVAGLILLIAVLILAGIPASSVNIRRRN